MSSIFSQLPPGEEKMTARRIIAALRPYEERANSSKKTVSDLSKTLDAHKHGNPSAPIAVEEAIAHALEIAEQAAKKDDQQLTTVYAFSETLTEMTIQGIAKIAKDGALQESEAR